jgi:hypothetical protein
MFGTNLFGGGLEEIFSPFAFLGIHSTVRGTIMSRFDYVAYDDKAREKQAEAKEAFTKLDHWVETHLDNGRAKSLVFTKLEEAYMWIGKAIRDEQVMQRTAELQEGRSNE